MGYNFPDTLRRGFVAGPARWRAPRKPDNYTNPRSLPTAGERESRKWNNCERLITPRRLLPTFPPPSSSWIPAAATRLRRNCARKRYSRRVASPRVNWIRNVRPQIKTRSVRAHARRFARLQGPPSRQLNVYPQVTEGRKDTSQEFFKEMSHLRTLRTQYWHFSAKFALHQNYKYFIKSTSRKK